MNIAVDPGASARVVWLSRLLWEQVLVPWVLVPARVSVRPVRLLPAAATSCLLRAAEAAFPLVALCCRAVAPPPLWEWARLSSAHYRALEDAAAAPSPRCVAWLVAAGKKARRAEGGGGDGDWEREREGRKRAREQIAVLTGLCMGGHLEIAQRFVGTNCECWVEEGGEGPGDRARARRWLFWPAKGGTTAVSFDYGTSSALEAGSGGTVVPSLLEWRSMGSVFREENILVEEFWSRRGVFHLMEEVCSNGHLEVFKWIMSNLFQINEGNKLMTGDLLLVSAHKGQFLILKWLIETFGLDHFATSMCLGTSFRAKNGVYDLKSLVLTFPQWDFSSSWNLAISAGLARFSSADDIINVCQWLQDKFAFDGFVFTSWDKLPQHPKVIKWALSNVTDEYSLGDVWNLSCRQIGDIDLGKWFIEEKGIIPIPDNFISACSSKFSRVSFVEWLFKHVSLSSADLLSALHKALVAQSDRISKWLEDRYISTTNTRPKVSLFKLCLDCRYPLEEWFQWLFTHSSSCDIDCSESELVKIMSLTGTSKCKLCTAIFVWNKFSLSPVIHHDILVKLLDDVISYGTFSQVQQVFSLGEFSQSELEHISDTAVLESGKIAKWLVSSLAQNGNEPSALPSRKPPNLARIFVELLGKNKRGSAKWLFNKFHITLADVIVETKKPKATLSATVDLATWKLMLRLFPEITGNVARIHFIEIIAGSPLHAQFTSEKLGVSLNEIAQWCRDSGYSYSDTLWWIDWKNSNKKGS